MRALEGVLVIDFTRWGAAQCACALLGDWGAEVIKIEEPGRGDPMRGVISTGVIRVPTEQNFFWEVDGRNKKSVAVDVRKREGREIVYRLAARADVFVTSLLPHNLQKLEMDYEAISRVNPRIVYAQFTAFGEKGPDGGKGAHGGAAFWARSGLMAVHGEPGETSPRGRPGLGDRVSGLYLAGGIALALLVRERTGMGQKVSLSLLGAGVWTNGYDIQTSLSTGQEVTPVSRRTPGNPLWNTYRTGDGRWLMLTMLQTDPYWSRFCRALGIENLEHDPRFDSHEKRVANHIELTSILDAVFASKTLSEWADVLNSHNIPWAAAQNTLEVTADPQVLENEYIAAIDGIRLVACPLHFSRTPARIRSRAPELGQHTEEVLLQIGYTWEELAALKEKGVII